MTNAPIFPASKIKEIIMQDPDLKDIPKKGIEMLRVAAEQYVHYIFQKCSEEAKKKKRTTMNKKDFDAAIQNDPALRACLGQFYITEDEVETTEKTDEAALLEEKPEPVFEEEDIHDDLPEEKAEEKDQGKEEDEELSDSEEEEKKSEEPSMLQSEISDLESDDDM